MQNKKYPEVYQQIEKYYTLIAQDISIPNPEDFVARCVRNRYRHACKLIGSGSHSVQEVLSWYPLD